jgi:NCS1 family nucleobase:cation symporter-1
MMAVLGPLLPGLAASVSPTTVSIPEGLSNLYNISWLYGFHISIVLYWALSYFFPPTETFVASHISAFPDEMPEIEGIEQGVGSSTTSVHEKNVSVAEKSI